MSRNHRRFLPWSVQLALLLVLGGVSVFAWRKRPWVGDAEKVCRVAELSACPSPERSLLSNNCKIAWLERSMWSFDRLARLPHGEGPGGGDFLRALAREAGLSACPEADVVEQEFESWRRSAEAEALASAEPDTQRDSGRPAADVTAGGSTDEGPAEKRTRGIVKSEAPAVHGEIDPAVVAKEVRARSGAVKACYERALKRKPDLAGKLKIRWTITVAGTVSAVELDEDGMGDRELGRCITGLIGRWRFLAPPAGPADVVFPFVFEAAP